MNVLIAGSAPDVVALADADLSGLHKVALNNAWKVRPDFDHLVFPNDFPPERRAGPGYPGQAIGAADYGPHLHSAGGLVFCGATMAFAAGYWAAATMPGGVIGYIGCDMVYSGAQTHFYGNGTADPLRKNVSLQDLEAKSARLFLIAMLQGKLLVNCSEQTESRLVFPRVPLRDLANMQAPSPDPFRSVLRQALEALRVESDAPFDAYRNDYWAAIDTPGKHAFITQVDALWAASIPSIAGAWRESQAARPSLRQRLMTRLGRRS